MKTIRPFLMLWLLLATVLQGAPPADTTVSQGATKSITDALDARLGIVEGALPGKAAIASPAFTGTPSAPTATAGTSTTQLATTAFVTLADAFKAPLISPAFTGTPTAPTATAGTNTTQIATTAFVTSGAAQKAALDLSNATLPDARNNLQQGPDLVFNQGGLVAFWKALLPLETATRTAATWVPCWGMGDSIGTGSGPAPFVFDALAARYGVGGLVSTTLSGNSQLTATKLTRTLAGTASDQPATGYDSTNRDFTYWLNARFFTVPTGGGSSVTEAPTDTRLVIGWSKIQLFYGYRSGGGTISFDVKLDGATISGGAQTASTASSGPHPAGTINYVEITSAQGLKNHGALSIVTTSATAQSDYLGCIVYLDRGGIIPLQMGCGSSTYVEQAAVATANWTTFATACPPALTISGSKGETTIPAHCARLAANLPLASHVLLGNTPTTSGEAQDIADCQIYRTAAQTYGMTFINGMDFAKSWTYTNSLGLGGDGIHLSESFNRIYASWIGSYLMPPMPVPVLGNNFSGDRLMTYNEWSTRMQVTNTWRSCPLLSDLSNSTAATGWGFDQSRGFADVHWDTPASADTTEGIVVMQKFDLFSTDTEMFRFGLIDGFTGNSNNSVKIGFGCSGIYPPVGSLSAQGMTAEIGSDSSTAIWIRFEIHNGTTGYVSDKYYLPVADNGYGYKTGLKHNWVLKYEGAGSLTKRWRAWVCPAQSVASSSKTEKPSLVADWSPTIAADFTTSNAFLTFNGVRKTSAPGSYTYAILTHMEVDFNPDDATTYRPR